MLKVRWQTLPRLIRFMALHFADGVALGWSCALAMIWFNILNLGALLESHGSTLLTALFFLQSGLMFGTLAMGVAVMNAHDDD